MTEPLLTTKLYIPPVRPRLVSRPRLVERMRAGMPGHDAGLSEGRYARKLTLISAPAGFGKTTLLSACAAHCGLPVAWLGLDGADNDPARFLAYLVAALRSIEPGIGQGILGALQRPQAPPVAPLLVGLINDLAAIPAPFVLVLDDYHTIEAGAVHDAVAFLLDHQPPKMHLLIATRTDPPLPISRLRGLGQLTELRQNDLRFSLDEAAEFLNEAMGLGLSSEEIAALASRTEGWIAGLQMAAVSMRGRDDRAGFVHAFAGSHRHVLDYLMEEVLVQQPPGVQTFLLQTAILDRLTAPLCDAVLDGDAGQPGNGDGPLSGIPLPPGAPVSSYEILEYLDRNNLFVVPLDEERRWYRYHHLFADLLRQRLQQTQAGAVPDLHHRASLWCEEQGLMAGAIGHALSAEDYERALQLVERGAERAMARSEVATLKGWLEALPDEMIRTRPILCVYHTWGLLLSGAPVEVAEARLQDAVDADPEGSFAGEVLAVRALIATYQRKMRLSAELSRRALELLPEDRLFFRSFIAGYLGYGALYGGDLVAARRALEEAVTISQRAGNLMNAVLALCHLGDLAFLEANAGEARAFYEQALTLAVDDQGQRGPIAGLALIGLGGVELLQYNLQVAARHLAAGIDLIQRWGKAGAISGYVALARVRRVQGDLEGAYQALQTAEKLALQFDAMKADDAYVAAQKARLWLAQGDVEAVSGWLEQFGLEGEVSLAVREQDGDGTVPFNRLLLYALAA
ncbi:MAG: hypothetical protein PVI80_17530, partial [Anaerolineae bacterium]